MKNACYRCKHRRCIPGDAHSACGHPERLRWGHEPQRLVVVAHPYGVRNGFFSWPWNFDPIWLRECSGFEARAEAEVVS